MENTEWRCWPCRAAGWAVRGGWAVTPICAENPVTDSAECSPSGGTGLAPDPSTPSFTQAARPRSPVPPLRPPVADIVSMRFCRFCRNSEALFVPQGTEGEMKNQTRQSQGQRTRAPQVNQGCDWEVGMEATPAYSPGAGGSPGGRDPGQHTLCPVRTRPHRPCAHQAAPDPSVPLSGPGSTFRLRFGMCDRLTCILTSYASVTPPSAPHPYQAPRPDHSGVQVLESQQPECESTRLRFGCLWPLPASTSLSSVSRLYHGTRVTYNLRRGVPARARRAFTRVQQRGNWRVIVCGVYVCFRFSCCARSTQHKALHNEGKQQTVEFS